jgi:hypothetical protein
MSLWRELVATIARLSTCSSPRCFLLSLTYVSIRQHTSAAYVSIRQHTSSCLSACSSPRCFLLSWPYVSIHQHTAAYVSIRQHTSSCLSACSSPRCFLQSLPYVSIRQQTSAYARARERKREPRARSWRGVTRISPCSSAFATASFSARCSLSFLQSTEPE